MKKIIRGILFLSILFLILYRVYNILEWKDTSGDYLSSTTQLYSTGDELIDVVFFGSSHCYCAANPDALWREYGYAAFNMTTSGQDKQSTYYLLKEILKTQSPKVVCVELWGLTFDRHAIQGNVYRNMMAMNLSRNSIDLVQAYVDEEEQADYILRWPIMHTRYKELRKYDFKTYEYSEYGRGLEMSYRIGWSEVPTAAIEYTKVGELTDTNREWLESLYKLSEEEGFELVLFLAPTAISNECQEQVNAAQEFAQQRGITFFDFNKLAFDIGLDYGCDFIDGTHLNARGSEKVTKHFGQYFEENCALEDNRGDEAYYQWEQSYTHYEQVRQEVQLLSISNFEDYAKQLENMNHITYVVSFEGIYKQSTLELENYAKALGISKELYETGGTFVFADGEMKHVLDNESNEVVIHELNKYDAFKFENMEPREDGGSNLGEMMLNMDSVGSIYSGLNIVVYDNFREKIIDKRGYY